MSRRLRPDSELTIWELRADPSSLSSLEEPALSASLAGALGEDAAAALLGLHLEADFAFIFFDRELDPAPWLASQQSGLDLRLIHRLRYDQWQDGAHGRPIRLGPLEIIPASWENYPENKQACNNNPEDLEIYSDDKGACDINSERCDFYSDDKDSCENKPRSGNNYHDKTKIYNKLQNNKNESNNLLHNNYYACSTNPEHEINSNNIGISTNSSEKSECCKASGEDLGSGHSPPTSKTSRIPPLIIDPGLAFGFGGHPTTLACLEFLIRVYHPHLISPAPIPKTVLDLGCGTGVLALAAARLGAASVLGVDHSHLAVDAAKRNAIANSLDARVTVVRGLAQDCASRPAELVMANIPMFVLKDLIDLRCFKNRKFVIVSGLLPDEGDQFIELLGKGRSLEIIDRSRSDRWMSYLINGDSI